MDDIAQKAPSPKESEIPASSSKASPTIVQDVEKDAADTSLQRQVSGPPYSVFSSGMKTWIIFLVSISAVISPFAATTYYPALNTMSDVLHVTPTMINISITTYMIAQAIAPAIIGGMSDTGGRRFSFIVCFVIFIIANIGLALQTNYAALLVLRMVQALGSSATISLSVAVVADLATSAERGKFMGYATAGILVGPAFGPTIGGLLAHYLGWRATFWFLAIYAGVLLFLFVFLFPETCRKVVGNGSIPPRGVNQSLFSWLQRRKLRKEAARSNSGSAEAPFLSIEKGKHKIPNPLQTLIILKDKESCIVLVYNGLFFTGMMMVSASLPHNFKNAYNYDQLTIGLCYISMGTGALISALTMGHVVDWNFRRHATRLNIPITKGKQQDLLTMPIEKIRLQVVVPGHLIGTAGLILFGWTVKFQTHIAGPEFALFLIGFGVSTAFNITNTLLIDLHRDKPATATAAVNFVRCLMSAGGSVAIIPMCETMNAGWAFTLMGLVYLALIGVVFWIMRDGMGWRGEVERRRRERESVGVQT